MPPWLAALAAVLCLVASAPAAAQSTRYPPQPKDVDEDSELKSKFWSEVIEPSRRRYDDLVAQANAHLNNRKDRQYEDALAALKHAISLIPNDPQAHWLLGVVHEQREEWQACAAAYERVFALDPDFRGSHFDKQRQPEWALDFSHGRCLGYLGQFEAAADHYRRIIARGERSRRGVVSELVYLALGEAYMALGQLEDAIDALSMAARLEKKQSARVHYSLAVAYDRDERFEESATHLDLAVRLDRELVLLKAADMSLAPASERAYYLGLVHAYFAQTRPPDSDREQAIAYFREYLQIAGSSPWTRSARAHLDQLVRERSWPSTVVTDGGMDPKAALALVSQADPGFQRCLAPVPNLLVSVRISMVGKDAAAAGSAPSVQPFNKAGNAGNAGPGVRATILRSEGVSAEAATAALECVEAAAARIGLSRIMARDARYVTVVFPLIAH